MGVELPQFTTCCCGCCTVRTGTLILLWMTLICVLFQPVYIMAMDSKTSDRTSSHELDFKALPWYYILFAFVWLIIAAAGLFGTYTEKATYLIPYLATQIICLLLYIIGAIIGYTFLTALLITKLDVAVGVISGTVVTFTIIFSILLNVYFWLVIFSHYRNLKENRRESMA